MSEKDEHRFEVEPGAQKIARQCPTHSGGTREKRIHVLTLESSIHACSMEVSTYAFEQLLRALRALRRIDSGEVAYQVGRATVCGCEIGWDGESPLPDRCDVHERESVLAEFDFGDEATS